MKKYTLLLAVVLSFQFAEAQPGTLDSSFGGNGKAHYDSLKIEVHCFTIQKDGKYLVGGYKHRNKYNNLEGQVIERFNQDSTIDKSFGTGGMVLFNDYYGYQTVGEIAKIAVDKHDKIVVFATFHPGSKGFDDIGLIRLNTDGTLDTKFNKTGFTITSLGYYHEDLDMIVQYDNSILVSGTVKKGDGNITFHFLMRSLSSGAADKNFGKNGLVKNFSTTLSQEKLVQQVDGKIILGGVSCCSSRIQIERYFINGATDSAFGTNGTVTKLFQEFNYMKLESIALQSDGKIITGGQFGATLGVTRFTNDGKFDSTFCNAVGYYQYNPGDNGSSTANTILIASNDKILVTGLFYWTIYTCSKTDLCANGLVVFRLSKNGIPDSTFGTNGIGITDFSDELPGSSVGGGFGVLQKDEKVVVEATLPSSIFGLVRFNTKKEKPTITVVSNERNSIKISNVKLYPNPATNVLYIEGLPLNTNSKLTITDLNGNIRMTATVNATSYTWNISRLLKGSYLVSVESKNSLSTITFIK